MTNYYQKALESIKKAQDEAVRLGKDGEDIAKHLDNAKGCLSEVADTYDINNEV